MAAEDNLSKQQWDQSELTFQVHRGVTRKFKKDAPLGMHWSADPQVARRFAGSFGTVMHAEVPISAVEMNTQKLSRAQVDLRDKQMKRPEKEVPVKPGAKVKVTGISGPEADPVTGNWNGLRRNDSPTFSSWVAGKDSKRPARKRTYKNPKEMQA
jgi:hypothetical protein